MNDTNCVIRDFTPIHQRRSTMVAGTRRMSSGAIKSQPTNQQKRKCTRADPAQTRILLENYDAEARPSVEQFAGMSRKTDLCAVLIVFAALSDVAVGSYPRAPVCSLPMLDGPPCRPVDWIKKWFLRKRKADGKNRTLTPTEPTFVENEPSDHDGQTLGHAHSKFWGMDAFAAADSMCFSPSVGHIPKFYGYPKRSLPPGNADSDPTDPQGNEEESAILSPGTSAGTNYGYAALSDSVLTCEDEEITSLASYSLREVLLGADAFAGYVSTSANGNASTPPSSENPNVTLTADGTESSLLRPAASSPERSIYPDNPDNERYSGSENITSLESTLANYPVPLISSPLETIDDFFTASGELDFFSTTSSSTSDLELGVIDSATGCLDLDLDSLPGFPAYMTSILDEHSAFYESLFLQAKQDPIGDSTDATNCSGLLGIDFCLGAGADHFALLLTGFEFRE
jgi:hypothetical protein